MTRSLIASLLAAAALALVPAAAGAQKLTAAQDAGGNQYTDPLDDEPSGTPTGTPTPTPTSSTPTSTGTTAPAATTEAGSTEAVASGKDGKPGIPRTGFPVVWLCLAGSVAIGAGLALRAAARPSP